MINNKILISIYWHWAILEGVMKFSGMILAFGVGDQGSIPSLGTLQIQSELDPALIGNN